MSAVGPEILLSLKGVSKSYPLVGSMRGRLETIFALLLGRQYQQAYAALQDIDLEVRAGESLGLVGVNGAGKSTLLKAIAGVVRPTAGTIERRGRISALLELGAGFHLEYTGRQNIFLASALMGLSEAETRARLDEVLAFADIGEHIDQPVKHYSSGMVVRLGFAVATSVQPDVLITDEVLAVGDESFQRKCTRWMEGYLSNGGTLLLCSHSMFHIEKLCRKAVWIHEGRMRAYGDAGAVTRDYLAWHDERQREAKAIVSGGGRLHAIRTLQLQNIDGLAVETFSMGQMLRITGTVFAPDDRPPVVAIGVLKSDGTPIYGLSSDMDAHVLERVGEREFGFCLELPDLALLPGRYEVRAHALDAEGYRLFDEASCGFAVEGESREMGVCRMLHRWKQV